MLHKIAKALEINITRLFNDDASARGPVAVMRDGQRPVITTDTLRQGPGVALERLVSGAHARLLQANIHHVAPQGSSDGNIEHVGEEMGFVLEGTLEISVAGTTYVLQKGELVLLRFVSPARLPQSGPNRSAGALGQHTADFLTGSRVRRGWRLSQ